MSRLSQSEFLKVATALGAREKAGENASAEAVAAFKQLTGRECGDCSLCCKVLDIDALNKPAGKWCQHCRPGDGGCSIYQTRPATCRDFACGWLVIARLGEEWKPSRARMSDSFSTRTTPGPLGISSSTHRARSVGASNHTTA